MNIERRLERVTLKGEILTPIHIGDGTDLEPLDYVIDESLYRINLGSFLSSLNPAVQQKFKSFTQKGMLGRVQLVQIRRFIKENFSSHSPYLWKAEVSPTVKQLYIEKFEEPENQLLISPFIRSADRPIIPGSSLKGVIRTALLNHWSKEIERPKVPGKYKEVEAEMLKALDPPRRDGDRYKFNIDKEIMRALRIEDIMLPDDGTQFGKVSNFGIKEGVLHETNIQMIREVSISTLSHGGSCPVEVAISIDHRYIKHNGSLLGRRDLDIDTVLSSCDSFYRRVLQDERKRFFYGRSQDIERIYDAIDEQSQGAFLLRIGWGSGFDAMTITKFRDQNIKWGKSKNLVEGKYPLGWIKIAPIS